MGFLSSIDDMKMVAWYAILLGAVLGCLTAVCGIVALLADHRIKILQTQDRSEASAKSSISVPNGDVSIGGYDPSKPRLILIAAGGSDTRNYATQLVAALRTTYDVAFAKVHVTPDMPSIVQYFKDMTDLKAAIEIIETSGGKPLPLAIKPQLPASLRILAPRASIIFVGQNAAILF
ncbi:hypothetical protein [Oryzifoliimicrobium ureilyticus]|uniref:hypothetical protein n=1 Tax=Oryzifoliimicrobium ureilyticus TaxID=3113724 RepID=UPI003075FEC9